jgi:dihydrolipoamide dehydrogenase
MRFASALLVIVSVSAFAPNKQAFRTAPPSVGSSALFMSDGEFDFDVAIIGCGVGGHGAALHSRGQGMSTGVFAGGDVGGTCVNRGCVPSKALLAASGRVREMRDAPHLESLGIQVEGAVTYSREGIANHAKNLASRVKGNLENSLISLGCEVIEGRGVLTGKPHEIKDEATGKVYTAKVRHCLGFANVACSSLILTKLCLPVSCTKGYPSCTWIHPFCPPWRPSR